MFEKKAPVPTLAEYQSGWIAACASVVPEPISTVALVNPPGAVAGLAAGIAGRSLGGLVGKAIATTVAANHVGPPAMERPLPAVLAVALTASSVHLIEVEPTGPDADDLRLIGVFDVWDRQGLRLDVSRKVMSERLGFTLADGRRIELDGMFGARSKERLYQPLVDQLSA